MSDDGRLWTARVCSRAVRSKEVLFAGKTWTVAWLSDNRVRIAGDGRSVDCSAPFDELEAHVAEFSERGSEAVTLSVNVDGDKFVFSREHAQFEIDTASLDDDVCVEGQRNVDE